MTTNSCRSRRLPAVVGAIGVSLVVAVLAGFWFKARADWREIQKMSPRIGTIDYYGLRTVSAQKVRAQLHLKEGDVAPIDWEPGLGDQVTKLVLRLSGVQAETDRDAITRRLEKIPGVARAFVEMVMSPGGNRAGLFVGIEETSAPHFGYRPVPAGTVALPEQMTGAYDELMNALPAAIAADADEDDSQGYALIKSPAMLPIERSMIAFAASNTGVAREVLKGSADARQRIAAAWILGYAPDKRAVVGDLTDAVSDPDETVRNNATRALAVIAEYAGTRPELGIHIDPSRFIEMLESPVWTDRNKATMVLLSLTEKPSPETLGALRARALPALTEMARWKDDHAEDELLLLGRIAGMKDADIQAAFDHGQRERVIALADATARSSTPAPHKP